MDDNAQVRTVSRGVWMIELPPMSVGTSCNISISGNGRVSFDIGFHTLCVMHFRQRNRII